LFVCLGATQTAPKFENAANLSRRRRLEENNNNNTIISSIDYEGMVYEAK